MRKQKPNVFETKKWLSVLFLFFLTLGGNAHNYTQNDKVSINVKNATLLEVIWKLQEQTDFSFFYNKEDIDDVQNITLNVKKQPIAKILEKCIKNTKLTFKIESNMIVFNKAKFKKLMQKQQYQIKGKVTDKEGEPLPGVSIMIKGTSVGTATDFDGNYSLAFSQNKAVFVFSFMGMETKEILYSGQQTLNVSLKADSKQLAEVVVVGYGIQNKSDLTGAVASIKAEDLKKTPTSNPINALQGQVAGVAITKAGGAPGSGSTITIRGIGTVGNNSPLYIVDGIPGSMSMLNPNDISSIEVLKDGAAAAIYGSRAANGVVLITTKKGKKGKIDIDFNMYAGVNSVINQLSLLDSGGYNKVHKMMYENYNKYASKPVGIPNYITSQIATSTNWQNEVMRLAMLQNYSININGGSENAYYGLSGSWNDEEGTLLGSEYLKKTLRAKLGMTKENFSIDANISYAETNSQSEKFSLWETYKLTPLIKPYTANGEVMMTHGDMPANVNPFAKIKNAKGESDLQYLSLNVTGKYKITEWLSYRTNLGYITSNKRDWNYHPKYRLSPKEAEDWIYFGENRNKYRYQIMEHLINFNKDFDKHSITAVFGYTASKATNDWLGASVEGKKTVYSVVNGKLETNDVSGGFLDSNWKTIDAGKGGTFKANGSNNKYTQTSILGRINYSYNQKYLLQVTARKDGSSKFGSNSRYGTFPSIALGWKITEEDFMENYDFINNLKLRASWGKLGNEVTLGLYDHQALVSTGITFDTGYVRGVGTNPWAGSIATGLENKELQWETSISKNIGLDYSFLRSKFRGSLNYYVTNTKDMLIYRQLPGSAGLDNPVLNVGEIKNKGIEFELGYYENENEFTYGINTTLATTKNEVLKLADKDQILFGEGLKYGTEHFPTQTRVGHEIGAFFLYKTNGLFQSLEEVKAHKNNKGELLQKNAKPGDIRFIDTNNDGKINEKDKVYQGSGIPDITYSVNFNAVYKGIDFSMMFYGVAGNKLYNGNRYRLEGMAAGQNFMLTTLNAWTETNKNTNMPRAILGDPNQNMRASDRYLESGSFLRLKSIELGYTLPKEITNKLGVDKCRIYINTQNVFTITKYSGIDPEIGRGEVLNLGVDKSFYPINQSFFGGIQLSL